MHPGPFHFPLKNKAGPRGMRRPGSKIVYGSRRAPEGRGAVIPGGYRLTVPSQVSTFFCFLSESVNQRDVTTLVSVKKRMPS